MPEAERRGHCPGDTRILEDTFAGSAIEVCLNLFGTVSCDQRFLRGQKMSSCLLSRVQNLLSLDDAPNDRCRKRVGEVEGDEVKTFFFFPVRQPAAVSDSNFTESGRHCALDELIERVGTAAGWH
jgi:hypothetical protein